MLPKLNSQASSGPLPQESQLNIDLGVIRPCLGNRNTYRFIFIMSLKKLEGLIGKTKANQTDEIASPVSPEMCPPVSLPEITVKRLKEISPHLNRILVIPKFFHSSLPPPYSVHIILIDLKGFVVTPDFFRNPSRVPIRYSLVKPRTGMLGVYIKCLIISRDRLFMSS